MQPLFPLLSWACHRPLCLLHSSSPASFLLEMQQTRDNSALCQSPSHQSRSGKREKLPWDTLLPAFPFHSVTNIMSVLLCSCQGLPILKKNWLQRLICSLAPSIKGAAAVGHFVLPSTPSPEKGKVIHLPNSTKSS